MGVSHRHLNRRDSLISSITTDEQNTERAGQASAHAPGCPCFACAERRAFLRGIGRTVVPSLDFRGKPLPSIVNGEALL